ncbi:MAG: S24 family peptidase [Bacteroidota bacterium]
MLSGGDYRAFEILGDSMLPTPSGSVIVCDKIDSPDEVKSHNTYIVVSRNEGIVYKRILKSNRAKNKLTLVSDNPVYQPYNINTDDVLGNMAGTGSNIQSRSAATLGCRSVSVYREYPPGPG